MDLSGFAIVFTKQPIGTTTMGSNAKIQALPMISEKAEQLGQLSWAAGAHWLQYKILPMAEKSSFNNTPKKPTLFFLDDFEILNNFKKCAQINNPVCPKPSANPLTRAIRPRPGKEKRGHANVLGNAQ